MPVSAKQLAGVMNTDDNNEVIPPVHHKIAYNMRFRGIGANYRGENIPGTRLLVNSALPDSGDNECIGAFYDQVRQRIYYGNYNSGGKNGLYYYDIKLNTFVSMLVSFINSSVDIFNFSLDNPIVSMNIIYATDSDGDIIFWNTRNNRPQKLNILDAVNNVYNNAWLPIYLTVARPMPLISPVCSYHDDLTVNINNLRKKLYEFRYRWVYRNNEKSTCSPYSKLFAPQNPDDIATDINAQKNNRIDAIINTGGADVIKIEVIARCTQTEIVDNSAVTVFSDNFLVATLVKSDLSLADNILYTYQFFNDQAYPFIDVEEADELFDYVPKIANAQELLNGNVLAYGGILFGYNFDTILNVTSNVTQVYNSVVQLPFLFSTQNSQTNSGGSFPYGGFYYVYMTGTPQEGDTYTITVVIDDLDNGVHSFSKSYTVVLGDTLGSIVTQFENLFTADVDWGTYHQTVTAITGSPTGIKFNPNNGRSHIIELTTNIVYFNPTPPPATTDVNIACYHERSKYAFGLVYFDEYGVTNGVVYQISSMVIETLEVDTTLKDTPRIPAISFEINHIPPSWAVSYAWVRTDSLTFATTVECVSDSTQKDTEYGYIEITNYQTNTSNFPAYSFNDGDRVRIIGEFVHAGAVLALDFPLVALLTDPTINSFTNTGIFLKIPFDPSITAFGTTQNYSIEIYTPTLNTDPALQVYYEFGESYQILNPKTVNRLHQGQLQDQTSLLPATFTFTRGDYYIRQRLINNNWIIDPAVNDNYSSHISGTGRAFVSDVSAKEVYFPTQFRWSLAYQSDTNINQTNRFYPLNFDEFDRAKGDIQRLIAYERLVKVGQSRYWGEVGVYTKFIQDSNGTQTLTTTDNIITANNIQYYEYEYGVGDQYTAVVKSNNRIYFADPVRGELCRLSNDGIDSYSALYKGQYYLRSLLTPYNKDWIREDGARARILMCYDYFEENALTLLQEGVIGDDVINNYSFGFNEPKNGFVSFYDFHPEWIMSAEDKVYSWKDGQLYVHDDEINWTTFYGETFFPSIKLVFNEQIAIKKKFNANSYQSNQIWVSDTNGDINTSMFNQQTGFQQISQLKIVDYTIEEGRRYAALLFDANSMSNAQLALVEGDYLEGDWVEINYIYKGNNFAWIYLPYVFWEVSQRNF